MLTLFPELKPYQRHSLKVSNLHELYLDEAGNPDGIPILFVHGGPGGACDGNSRRFYDPELYRIVTFDQRGCGRSTPVDVPQQSALWAEDMKQLMDSLGLEQAYLGGVSYGGMLLIEFLMRYQARCRAALIVSATARGRDGDRPGSVYFPRRLGELSAITVPALVVQATDDHIFPPEHGEEMAAEMPNAELVVLEGGHTINNEQPDEFNRVALEFLART